MATMMEIEEAIKSIETKKQSLKQSFLLLLQHSHCLSPSLSLSWPQIDSHFSHIQSSLQSRFSSLQSSPLFHHQKIEYGQSLPSLEQTLDGKSPRNHQLHKLEPTQDGKNPRNDQKVESLPNLGQTPDGKNPGNDQRVESLPRLNPTQDGKNPRNDQKEQSLPKMEGTQDGKNPRDGQMEGTPEGENPKNGEKGQKEEDPDGKNPKGEDLREVCERMDSKNLRKVVQNRLKVMKEWGANELSQALKHSPNPYKLVLDSIEEWTPRGLSSVILLESLMLIEGIEVSEEMRDRAKCMSKKWYDELDEEDKFPYDVLSLLTLLGVFKLVDEFDRGEVMELVYMKAKIGRALKLCRVLGLEDRVPELVQKLIDNKRELVAIKYVQEFNLSHQFSPVMLLKSYLNRVREAASQIRNSNKNDPKAMNDADAKEKTALRIVIELIKDYDLESEFPPGNLERRLKKLDEMRDERKSKKLKQRLYHEQPPHPVPTGPPPPRRHGVGPSSVGPYGTHGFMDVDPRGPYGPFGPQLHSIGASRFVDGHGFPHYYSPYHPR